MTLGVVISVVLDPLHIALAQRVVEDSHDNRLRGARGYSFGERRRAGCADKDEKDDQTGDEYHDTEGPLPAKRVCGIQRTPP